MISVYVIFFTKLTGHGIATAQTSNMIAVMNAAGLLGGVLRITPVKNKCYTLT